MLTLKALVVGLTIVIEIAVTVQSSYGDEPSSRPTAGQSTIVGGLVGKMQRDTVALRGVFDASMLTDAPARASHRAEAVPALRALVDDFGGLAQADPRSRRNYVAGAMLYEMDMASLGDPFGLDCLTQLTGDGDAKIAFAARCQLLASRWYLAAGDPAAQTPVVVDAEKMMATTPTSNDLSTVVARMGKSPNASPVLQARLNRSLADTMKTRVAESVRLTLSLPDRVGRPMAIIGRTVDGKAFSTDAWKGKVVLVDFWATWCGPCVRELPRVHAMYDRYHGAGLEVLGVSNDHSAEALKAFVAKQNMAWPQLFDEGAAAGGGWNPATAGIGIDAIPTFILIDKKGVCRSVTAREDLETQIPKLLAE